jgi:peptidoglycan/xylan/chitin deacetylase (PgdA/CDA1 family)
VPATLPHYYSSLVPFREVFAGGLPILTYHKLGPRPPRVRLKGLYVSSALFDQQLAELREAGFRSVPPDHGLAGEPEPLGIPLTRPSGTLSPAPSGGEGRGEGGRFMESASETGSRPVVITFDDGFRNVFEHGLPLLARHGFRAIQFLLPDRLGQMNTWEQMEGEAPERLMDPAEVRDWLGAGHWIGSHTCTHPWLTRLPLPQAREEIASSKHRLEDRFGVPVEHFCYPYGDWNEPVRELVAAAGYRTACTVEPGVNTPGTPRLALKRFTARYPSRTWRGLLGWLLTRAGRSGGMQAPSSKLQAPEKVQAQISNAKPPGQPPPVGA